MLAILSRLFTNMLLAGCCFSLTFFFISLALTFRLLPKLLPFLRKGFHWFLILSARFYALVLGQVFAGITRVVITSLLSIGIGTLISWITSNSIHAWVVVFSAIHGITIGLAWDNLLDPGGLHLGMDVQ